MREIDAAAGHSCHGKAATTDKAQVDSVPLIGCPCEKPGQGGLIIAAQPKLSNPIAAVEGQAPVSRLATITPPRLSSCPGAPETPPPRSIPV